VRLDVHRARQYCFGLFLDLITLQILSERKRPGWVLILKVAYTV